MISTIIAAGVVCVAAVGFWLLWIGYKTWRNQPPKSGVS